MDGWTSQSMPITRVPSNMEMKKKRMHWLPRLWALETPKIGNPVSNPSSPRAVLPPIQDKQRRALGPVKLKLFKDPRRLLVGPTSEEGAGNTPNSALSTLDLNPEDPQDTQIYYGMQYLETGDCEITNSISRAKAMKDLGWHMRKTFNTLELTIKWKNNSSGKNPLWSLPIHPLPSSLQTGPKFGCRPSQEHATTPGQGAAPSSGDTPLVDKGITIYGMENGSMGDRTTAVSWEEVELLCDSGFALRRLFWSQEEADTWAGNRDFLNREASKMGVQPTQHATKVGPDPSTANKEVFGVNIDQIDEADHMLLPAGTGAKETDDIYNCVVNVMALPGGYKSSVNDEDEEQGDVAKALMTIATGKCETGLHMQYNARNQNGLQQIKSASDLAEFIEERTRRLVNTQSPPCVPSSPDA